MNQMNSSDDLPLYYDAIQPYTRSANYRINTPWTSIERWLKENEDAIGTDLDPDFQRAHVWDETKQRRYVEHILREGKSSRDLYFNSIGWDGLDQGPLVLVDGKQRLEAVRKFLGNDLRVFPSVNGRGYFRSEIKGRFPKMYTDFVINVNNLGSREEVLQWYLDLNSGGVAHTDDELQKVRVLLEQERP